MGDDDAALAGFEHYLTIDPKDPYVRYQIGEIWLDRHDMVKAEEQFRRALETDPKVAAARNALGVIALQRGDRGNGAERMIREAIATKPDVRLAHFNLALLAEQRGDVREAEREYFEELKRHPDSYKSAFNLSRLYEQIGDREGQIGALKQSIQSNPQFAEGHFYPGQGVSGLGRPSRRSGRSRAQGTRARAAVRVCGARPLRSGGCLQPSGAPRDAAREAAAGRSLEKQFPAGKQPSTIGK